MVIFGPRVLLSERFSLPFIPHYVIYKNLMDSYVQTKDVMCKAREKKITQDWSGGWGGQDEDKVLGAQKV